MQYLKTIYYLLSLLLLGTSTAHGYYYKQYTTSNLLISNTVYHSFCDRKGYMWFFTDKGISKFDGATFKNFTVFDGLSDNDIFYAFEDQSGRLWLYTYNGIPCFIRNDSIYNQTNDQLLKKLPTISFISTMHEDKDSSIYFGYHLGEIIKVSGTNYKVITGPDESDISTFSKNKDTLLAHKKDSTLYIKNETIVYVAKTKRAKNYHDFNYLLSVDNDGVNIHYGDSLVWQRKDVNLNFKNVIQLYFDEEDHLFCATHNGLSIINIKNNTTDILFENAQVSCTSRDIYGNYWVTTLGNGIYYLDKNLDKIKPLNINNSYKTFVAKNGQLFFTKDNTIHYFKNNALVSAKLPINIYKKFEPLLHYESYFFYVNGDTSYCFDTKNNKSSVIALALKNIYAIDKNKFLLTGRHQLSELTIENNRKNIKNISDDYMPSKTNYDSKSKAFYFIENALFYKYDLKTQAIRRIDSIKYNTVENIFCLNNFVILFIDGNKAISYDCKRNYEKTSVDKLEFTYYDLYGLRDKFILSTNKGYYITKNKEDLYKNYSLIQQPVAKPDLVSLHAIDSNVVCNINGSYYSFSSSLLNSRKDTPRLFIDKININGKNFSEHSMVVKHRMNTHISISVSSLKFNNLINNFKYRIIHDDTSQWYNSTTGKLDFLVGKYGNYAIELCAVTENNIASPRRTLFLNILPPFYYSFTFYFIVAVLLGLCIFFALRIYHGYRAKLFQNELNYLQLEYRAINSLLNPHFIFNAINNIQNLINIDSRDKANNYLAILSKLIRQNIDNLQFNFISLQKELNLVKNYIFLQNLRFDNKIKLKINDTTESLDNIQIPPLLIHTFVENAVVHGFKKGMETFTINIDMHLSVDGYLIIKIADNGTGFKTKDQSYVIAPESKTSIGIDFTRKRLARLSSFYKVEHSLEIKSSIDNGQNTTEAVVIIYSKFKELSKAN